MIKTLIVAIVLFGSVSLMSFSYFGYSRAGKSYISKRVGKNRSIRRGSPLIFATGYRSSGSFRSGK